MSINNAKVIDQKEYLKKYLSGDKEKKKKHKHKKHKKAAKVKIIDDDAHNSNNEEVDEDLLLGGEDAPQIVGEYIEENPSEVRSKWRNIAVKTEEEADAIKSDTKIKIKEEPRDDDEDNRWGRKASTVTAKSPLASRRIKQETRSPSSDQSPPRRWQDDDQSPPRRKENKSSGSNTKNRDDDQSPPRRKRDGDPNLKGRVKNEDVSPRRKKQAISDQSPPRRRRDNDQSPPHRRTSSSDQSPPRRRNDSDLSPLRRRKRSPVCSPSRNQKNSQRQIKHRFSDQSPSKKRRDSDQSPPRRRRRSSDQSPPRREKDRDQSPPRRKRRSSDQSPPRREKDRDQSPPRRKRQSSDQSPPRREKDRDQSPPRRKRRSSDQSPPRREKDRHQSPPRRRRSSDNSPPRRDRKQTSPQTFKKEIKRPPSPGPPVRKSRWAKKSPSPSPPPTHKPKSSRTLDGKKAGLQDAQSLKAETDERRRREHQMFEQMSNEVSGRDADIQIRSTGRRGRRAREAANEDPTVQKRKEEHERKKKELYDRWGRGLKQLEDHKSRQEEMAHEAAKPVARYANDEDLDRHLREQEHADDPMLEYMRAKRKKQDKEAGKPVMPKYEGSFPENRFGIPPGYRWDGVDRSNGYEKRWFNKQNERRAVQDEAYKYSVEDM